MQEHLYKHYVDEIGRDPLLSLQEEKDLSYIIIHSKSKKKVEEAVNKMVMSNLRLAATFALKAYQYHAHNPSIKMSLMDYVQEANKAVIRAAEHYDAENSNARFGTYAVPTIKNAIIKAIKHSRVVRIPEDHFSQISAIENLYSENGIKLTDTMIMDELNISKKYLGILRASIDTSIIPNKDDTISDMFISKVPSVTTNIQTNELREYLLLKIKELTPIEKDAIFFMFFGYSTPTIMAKKHGVSQQRISQAFLRGLKKLRRKIEIENKITKEHLR